MLQASLVLFDENRQQLRKAAPPFAEIKGKRVRIYAEEFFCPLMPS